MIRRSVGALVCAFSAACSREGPPPGAVERPNFVVLVVDGWRREIEGHARPATPVLDALARTGLRFDAAYATSSWNVPAVASMWTGLAPSEHGLQAMDAALSDRLTTIAGALQQNGYATGAVVSEFRVGRARGFDQGFEFFEDAVARGDDEATAAEVSALGARLLERLSGSQRPFLAWIHYHDPHPSWIDREGPDMGALRVGSLRGGESLAELRHASGRLSANERGFVRALYAKEVGATDAAIGDLLEALDELDLERGTFVFVLGSSGVELFERGGVGPATSLYQEQVCVPLLVRPPDAWEVHGGERRQVVTDAVSLGGLAATLADLAYLRTGTREDFVLPSFAERLRGRPLAPRIVRFELDYRPVLETPVDPQRLLAGATDGRFKLVADLLQEQTLLFDLKLDPGETKDISRLYPREVERLAPAP